MDDSDDSDDFLSDTFKWRSQPTPRYKKTDFKPSKLSLSYRSSQPVNNKPKVERNPPKVKSVPSQAKTTPPKAKTSSKTKTTPSKSSKIKIKKGTPVKSRADHPEENCTASQLAQWEFLYGSQSCKIEKSTPQKRKGDSDGEASKDSFSSGLHYKKRNSSGECVPHRSNERQDEQRCHRCSYPFKTSGENALHAILCSTTDLSNLPRCYEGSQCQEITEQHFLKFNHRENSIVKNLLCNDVNSNTLVKTNFITSTPRGNVAGPSTSMVSSVDAASDDQFSVITVESENEASTLLVYKEDSSPLFDLEETEDHRAPLDKEPVTSGNQDHSTPFDKEPENSENSHVSSNLLDYIPDIDLDVDDQETVCFDTEDLHANSSTKEDRQENQKSPSNHDDNFVSERADLKNSETAADALEDPEGDELIANLSEEAIDQFAIPLLEKIIKWRKSCEEAQSDVPPNENNQSTGLKKTQNIIIQPRCIHLHYHEANPVQSHTKENGQTSILNYFTPKISKEERCSCSENKMVSKQDNIAAWQRLMGHKQKRSLVPLPSVSQNSSSENSSTRLSKTQERNKATSQRWGRRETAEPKNCPFYKYIPETSFVVDAFSYGSVAGVTAYFLSHFHYDHYCGLQRNFSHPIYCSEITARLVNKRLGVPLQYLNPLPMWKPQEVCGVEVTLLDANHCPGAVMFLFKVKSGVKHLHVGDFRAHPSMERYPALQCPIHSLFLDTTYCSPEHDFPTQEKMIEKCVSLAQDHHLKNAKTLFVVGSYTIGKERVFKAIASNLNSSIWVKDYKKQVLNCINDKDIVTRLTPSKTSAKVHVLPMSEVKGQKLKEYLNQLRSTFTEVVGICPTGWEFTSNSNVGDISEHPYPDVYIYGIPYSEHSNFSELRRFVQFIKPKKIIPTVNNGSQASRKKMERYFLEWQTRRLSFS